MNTIIAGNWKMNKTVKETADAINELIPLIEGAESDVIICPPFTALGKAAEVAGSSIGIGAQNLYFEDDGAFTGEISGSMIKELADYVIIGHSERRHVLGETDDEINKKIKKALEVGLTPIFCVGEKIDQREADQTNNVLKEQLEKGLKDVPDVSKLILAYEPVWAIGTGKVATPEIAQDAHAFIRETITSLYDDECAKSTPILYGGSVKPDNVKGLMEKPDINGALVGGASLDPKTFAQIVKW